MPGRDIIQRPLELMNQRGRCSDGPKSSQGRQAVGANTHLFLRSVLRLYLIDTGYDSIYLHLKALPLLHSLQHAN